MTLVPRMPERGIPLPPGDLQNVLVVEDEELARKELTRFLTKQGLQVLPVATGSSAIEEAGSGDVGVVLMDIVLNEGNGDGVDAAVEIKRTNPNASVIFVSAYAQDSIYREKALKGRLRAGEWVEKPIDLSKLLRLIVKEMWKVQIRTWLDRARRLGKNPEDEFLVIRRSYPQVPPEVIGDIVEELGAFHRQPEEQDMETVSAEIDRMYSRIREVVAGQAAQPVLSRAIRPLRRELRRLQVIQADAMESYFLSQLKFDPNAGEELIKRAERLLKKR